MAKILEQLEVVAIEQLIPHESTETKRLDKLVQRIAVDDKIINPLPCVKEQDHYYILDGHHRYFAAKQLGCRFIPVQVIDASAMVVKHWLHEMPQAPLQAQNKEQGYLFAQSATQQFYCPNHAQAIYQAMWALYDQYKGTKYKRELVRMQQGDFVQYVGLTWDLVKQYAHDKMMLPPCVTRFVLPMRMLNIDMPLSYLQKERANEALDYIQSLSESLMFSEPTISLARALDVNKMED